MASAPVAVIDIGSNSGRVVVYELGAGGHLQILASSRASLRLVRDLSERRTLSAQAVARTLDALHDFDAIARGSGARQTLAVATSAVRDAKNGPALLAAARKELGLDIRILTGAEEARLGFLGAVRGLPVEDGALFDVGGGSMQVAIFEGRKLGQAWSFPLGSLRLSDEFLTSDPPTRGEQRRLVEHIERTLEEANLPPLAKKGTLVGTGGTVRNLAKVDQRRRGYPIPRLHAYVLSRKSVADIVGLLASRKQQRRVSVSGLNDDRADSIVGGGLAVLTLMKALGARDVHVSGQGVREGLAESLVSDRLPPPRVVRANSIAALAGAFRQRDQRSAAQRVGIASTLFSALEPEGDEEVAEALAHGCNLLDVGRSIDYFDRHEHVADIVLATDLLGFSHRDIALLSAVVRRAGDETAGLGRYEPLLTDDDHDAVERAATLLALADEIEQRSPNGSAVAVRCEVTRREARVSVMGLAGWRPRRIHPRFERAFGLRLVVLAR